MDQVIGLLVQRRPRPHCPDTGSSDPDPKTPRMGPISGSIPHLPDDGEWELSRGFENIGDVMIEVTFENPYPPAESHWIYGIYLKSSPEWSSHRIFFSSWKTWRHSYYSAEQDRYGATTWEDAPGIDVSEGGENHLRLIKVGDTGWLYINDRFVGNINFALGDIPEPYQIFLVLDDDGKGINFRKGDVTHFHDYTIWKWHPIPVRPAQGRLIIVLQFPTLNF